MTNFTPTYYDIAPLGGAIRLTDEVTKKPVSESNPFYQEKQSGGKCSVHSMNAFAGTKIVEINELFKLNNDVNKKALEAIGMLGPRIPDIENQRLSDIEALKENHLYLGTLEDLDQDGAEPIVVKSYLETYKNKFGLPSDCSINSTQGLLTSVEVQTEINRIQSNPNLHRLILGIGAKHYLTIRKDKKNQWRVIDSQIVSHNETAVEQIKKIQPGFGTLKNAIEHVSRSYNSSACILISPTKEKTGLSWGWYVGLCIVALGCTALSVYQNLENRPN